MFVSVVIPAYNESENIGDTVADVSAALDGIDGVEGHEIIVVDDHSGDGTYEAVKALGRENARCIRLSRRGGSHLAIRAGLSMAGGDAVLVTSADGQDDPAVIGELIGKWKEGKHIVWALRRVRKESLLIKLTAILFYKMLGKLASEQGSGVDLSRADFCLLDRSVVAAINGCPERYTALFGLLVWFNFDQDYVEYDRRLRRRGSSKWNFKSRLLIAWDWIAAFSGLPLKLMSVVGMVFALLGFAYALVVVINALSGNPVQGWSSIMVAVLVLGGIQMVMLGVIGEYLWRNLEESRRRPLFVVERDTASGVAGKRGQ